MNNTIYDTLVATIRAGLTDYVPSLSDKVNWHEFFNTADYQGVSAICLSGLQNIINSTKASTNSISISSFVNSYKSDKRWLQWIGAIMLSFNLFEKHKQVIQTISSICERESIPLILMKGLGVGLNYPIPQNRPCGDVDIYVGRKYKDDVTNILKETFHSSANIDNPKHAKVNVEGVTIEIHESFSDVEISSIERKAEDLYESIIEETEEFPRLPYAPYCKLPPHNLNHIFLLRHMAAHFRTRTSSNLRQIIDWGLFLKAHHNDLDIESNKKHIADLGLKRLNNAFLQIAEDLIGNDNRDYFIGKVDNRDKQRVLKNMLKLKPYQVPNNKIIALSYKIFEAISELWKLQYYPDSFSKLWYGFKFNFNKI